MSKVLILQAFGLGDCIFAQGIANHFYDLGYEVVWPVQSQNVDGLRTAYPAVSWIEDVLINPELFLIKEKIEVNGFLIAPIRWSDSYMKVPYRYVMRAKYDMYEMDWKKWKEAAKWVSNRRRENELFSKVVPDVGKQYRLVNTYFSGNGGRQIDILPSDNMQTVEMKIIPGYSLFDWAKVITYASEIHTVSTSLLYLLEIMDLTMPIHLYPRKPIESDFSFVDYLFTKPYILHQ